MFVLEATNFFRGILWSITKACLGICDYCYGMLKTMMGLKMENLEWFWKMYQFLVLLVILFVLARLLFMYLKSTYDETVFQRISGLGMSARVVMIAFILSATPILMPLAFNSMTTLTTKLPSLITNGNDVTISQVITDASLNGFAKEGSATSITKQKVDIVNNMKEKGGEEIPTDLPSVDDSNKKYLNIYKLATNNINARQKHNAESYYFFNDIVGIILALIMGGICAVLILYISFQVAQRYISLLYKILLTPYAVSGLINPTDNGTSTWFKLCIADILGNFFQMLFVWLSLVATAMFDQYGLVKAIFFIASLIGILNAPQGIAQILGSDIGATSGMQGIRQAMQFGTAALAGTKLATAGVKYAGGKVGSVAGTTVAVGSYAGARALGMDLLQSEPSEMESRIGATPLRSDSYSNPGGQSSPRASSQTWKVGSKGQFLSNTYRTSGFGQSMVGGMVRNFVNSQISKGNAILHGSRPKKN
ncbi:hypothetical protein [Bulleidia sp. zg-1006]|uniref:hypothetical protein n=1 Tax=Bulleidia sp. zg-1006 TaxID=2806552 RepID=UPI00193A0103|nr:hypothetical protein [Bulleidia sp. zg-1006]QRG86934.1 hypothetical protein JOS54_01045 [Bulleidia sp. zg-1006]